MGKPTGKNGADAPLFPVGIQPLLVSANMNIDMLIR